MNEINLKNNMGKQIESQVISYNETISGNKPEKNTKDQIASLRARLMELFAEQKNWQKQLLEVGENMTFDDVRNQIMQANEKIAKHQDIIVKCEEFKRKNKRWIEQLWYAKSEYTTIEVDYDGNEPIDSYGVYSIEHSQKRIAFWKEEIAKYEQKLQMMDIAQQQLAQVMEEIADVNEKIKNAATCQTSEPLVEETSNIIENTSTSKINTVTTKLYRIDNLSMEICQDKFNDIIITSPKNGKQKVLRGIRNNMSHFNPDCFSHEELANELNNLQTKFIFTKADVDKAYQYKNA